MNSSRMIPQTRNQLVYVRPCARWRRSMVNPPALCVNPPRAPGIPVKPEGSCLGARGDGQGRN